MRKSLLFRSAPAMVWLAAAAAMFGAGPAMSWDRDLCTTEIEQDGYRIHLALRDQSQFLNPPVVLSHEITVPALVEEFPTHSDSNKPSAKLQMIRYEDGRPSAPIVFLRFSKEDGRLIAPPDTKLTCYFEVGEVRRTGLLWRSNETRDSCNIGIDKLRSERPGALIVSVRSWSGKQIYYSGAYNLNYPPGLRARHQAAARDLMKNLASCQIPRL